MATSQSTWLVPMLKRRMLPTTPHPPSLNRWRYEIIFHKVNIGILWGVGTRGNCLGWRRPPEGWDALVCYACPGCVLVSLNWWHFLLKATWNGEGNHESDCSRIDVGQLVTSCSRTFKLSSLHTVLATFLCRRSHCHYSSNDRITAGISAMPNLVSVNLMN